VTRMTKRRNKIDLICGVTVMLVGIYAASSGFKWDFGSFRRIGPGAFPAVVGAVLIGLGLMICILETGDHDAPPPGINLRGLLFVIAGLGSFAILIRPAGMVPAVFACVLLASLADPKFKLRDALGVCVVMSVLSVGIFIWGLGFQAKAFGAY